MMQTIIAPLGTNVIAAYNIAYNIVLFIQIPNTAMYSTVFMGSGMCMGAGRPQDVRKWYRKMFWLDTAVYGLLGLLLVVLFDPVVSLFHPQADMIPSIWRSLMLIMAVMVVFHTAAFTDSAVLRAAGDVTAVTILSAASMWCSGSCSVIS